MSPRSTPVISVIIAVYNGHSTLRQCLDSIIGQKFQNMELIVIDGGSTDGTLELLGEYSSHLAYWISEPDKGIYNAWNKALVHAKGDWICFLGADDFFWSVDVLKQMAIALIQVPSSTQLAYAQIMLFGEEDTPLYTIGKKGLGVQVTQPDVMKLPPHPGLMHRRSLFQAIGGFDEDFRIAGDTELLIRALQQSDAHFVPDLIIVGMRQGGISSKPSNVLRSLKELRRIQRKHGITWPGYALILAWLRAVTRWMLWSVLGERFTRHALDFGRRIMGKPAYWTRTQK